MGKKVKTPPPRNAGKEFRDTLEAQIDLAPELFAAEANPNYGRGAYAQLDLQVLRDTLLGTGGTEGLLDLYENETQPGLARADAAARRVQRESDIRDVAELGGEALAAQQAANPQQAALVDAAQQSALNQLDQDYNARQAQGDIRAAQAARGFGFGVGDVAAEGLFVGRDRQRFNLGQQQIANAALQNTAYQADPFQAILGRPASNAGLGLQQQARGLNSGQVFDPSAFQGVYAANQSTALGASQAAANANAGVLGSAIGFAGRGLFG